MKPKDLGYPHEIWTQRLLAEHIRDNCIKEDRPDLSKINQGTISRILNASKIKPHKISSYVAKVDPDFDPKAANVLNTYREAKRINEKKEKMNKTPIYCIYQLIHDIYPVIFDILVHQFY